MRFIGLRYLSVTVFLVMASWVRGQMEVGHVTQKNAAVVSSEGTESDILLGEEIVPGDAVVTRANGVLTLWYRELQSVARLGNDTALTVRQTPESARLAPFYFDVDRGSLTLVHRDGAGRWMIVSSGNKHVALPSGAVVLTVDPAGGGVAEVLQGRAFVFSGPVENLPLDAQGAPETSGALSISAGQSLRLDADTPGSITRNLAPLTDDLAAAASTQGQAWRDKAQEGEFVPKVRTTGRPQEAGAESGQVAAEDLGRDITPRFALVAPVTASAGPVVRDTPTVATVLLASSDPAAASFASNLTQRVFLVVTPSGFRVIAPSVTPRLGP